MSHRILHVLANSRPDMNGYAHRTHEILCAQDRQGIEVLALTSPWYPERSTLDSSTEVDGIIYNRCLHPALLPRRTGVLWGFVRRRGLRKRARYNPSPENESTESVNNTLKVKRSFPSAVYLILRKYLLRPLLRIWRRSYRFVKRRARPVTEPFLLWLEEKVLIKHFRNRIIDIAQEKEARIIHAHTPYRVGLPAMQAARRMGLPFVYEMRGAWEETAVANGRWQSGGLAHRRFKRKETHLLRSADKVVCIGEALRKDAIKRGVDDSRITVVPNGASVATMDESNMTTDDEAQLDEHTAQLESLEGELVVGYIGSIQRLEGLKYMVDSVARLNALGTRFKLLIVSASDKTELKKRIVNKGIEDSSMVIGPVPREAVSSYYSLIDIFCVPRPRISVAELVTPLKPMEAMMAGCATVVSDLPALTELVEDEKTGRHFVAEDIDSLCEVIDELSQDDEQRKRLGESARSWMLENRLWDDLVKRYDGVYSALCE